MDRLTTTYMMTQDAQRIIELAIHATPTGTKRDLITNANISILNAIDFLKEAQKENT